jgi:predicted lactoylglutathione lyase
MGIRIFVNLPVKRLNKSIEFFTQLEMLRDPDAAKSERIMAAILRMTKPDMQRVQEAYEPR